MALKKLHEVFCNKGVIFRTGFSYDGKILSSSHQNGCLLFWDAETGEQIGEHYEHNKITVRCLSWNPLDFRIASGDTDGHIVIWNYKTKKANRINNAHLSRVRTISWSPDGSKLLSGSSDGHVSVWDAETGKLIHKNDDSNQISSGRPTIYSAKWSPCGKYLASCLDKNSIIWDAVTYQEIKVLEGHMDKVRSVTWSKDGTKLASCSNDGSLIIWDTETWANETILSIRSNESPRDASIFCVHFSPNQRFLLTKSTDNAVRVWRLRDKKCIAKIEELCGNGQSENLGGLSFHPTLPLFVSLRNECQHLRIWEMDYDTLDSTDTYFDIDEGTQSSISNHFALRPEYEQAGLTILGYFHKILKTKYPELKASVHIIQEHENLTIKIITNENYREFVTNELYQYTEVVRGLVPIEEFLKTKAEITQLECQLAAAKMQIQVSNHLINYSKYSVEEVFKSLQESIKINNNILLVVKDSIDIQLKSLQDKLLDSIRKLNSKTGLEGNLSNIKKELESDLDKALLLLDDIVGDSDALILLKHRYFNLKKDFTMSPIIDYDTYSLKLNQIVKSCLDLINDTERKK